MRTVKPLDHCLAPRGVVLLLLVGCVAIGACSLATDLTAPGAMIKYTGDMQTAAVNTALPAPLAIIVVNQFGDRLKNVTVNWTIASGGGSLSTNAAPTDESGVASVVYTTGSTVGTAVINAQVHGLLPLPFTATITSP